MSLRILPLDSGLNLWVPKWYNIGVIYNPPPPLKEHTPIECVVCYDDECTKNDILKCGHVVCSEGCRPRLDRPNCPICNRELEELKKVVKNVDVKKVEDIWKGKQSAIAQYLQNELNINVLYDVYDIFSSFGNPVDLDNKFIKRLLDQKIVWENPKDNEMTYRSEYDRLLNEQKWYEEWLNYLPSMEEINLNIHQQMFKLEYSGYLSLTRATYNFFRERSTTNGKTVRIRIPNVYFLSVMAVFGQYQYNKNWYVERTFKKKIV